MRFQFAIFACLLAAAVVPHAAWAANRPADWLAISDLHLDPYDLSPTPARAGSDANRALLDSALRAMRKAVPDPALVVLPGDFLAHHFARIVAETGPATAPDDAGIAAMREIAGAFERTFPKAQFAIAVGNNDAPCGDYKSDLGGRFLAATARVWAPLVNRNGSAPQFVKTFARGGYYAIDLPDQRLRVVVLNTVLFSQEYRGPCRGGDRGAPARELAWLRGALHATPRDHGVVAVMHVPLGYDAVATTLLRGFIAWPYLYGAENAALADALTAPGTRVRFALAGHAHRFDVRLVGNVPLVVLGSLSPIYRNNPVFYRLRVEPGGMLRDAFAYSFDQRYGRWSEPHGFDAAWNVDRVDAQALTAIHARLQRSPAMRRAWEAASNGWADHAAQPPSLWNGSMWRIPWCAQSATDGRFARCAGVEWRSFAALAAVGIGLAAAAVFIFGIVAILRARA